MALPKDAQHGKIVEKTSGFNGNLRCWSDNNQGKCELTVQEANSVTVPGQFAHYIVVRFELKLVTESIAYLEMVLKKNPPFGFGRPNVLSLDPDSSVQCSPDQQSGKQACTLLVFSEN